MLVDKGRASSLVGAALALVLLASSPGGAAARRERRPAPTPSLAVLLAVRAVPDRGATNLDMLVRGSVAPALSGEGRQLVIRLPNTIPAARLGANLASGGLVSRIAVEATQAPARESRLNLDLTAPARAEVVPGPDQRTLRVRLASAAVDAPATTVRPAGAGLYDVDAYQSDVAGLLKSLARDAGVSVVMAGPLNGKVTVELRQTPVEQAIDLVCKSAGLSFHKDGSTFVVGAAKDIEAAYPRPVADPPKPPAPVMRQEVYHCRHVAAADLVAALQKTFEKDQLVVTPGAAAYSPRLDEATTTAVTGIQTSQVGATATAAPGTTAAPVVTTRDVVLSGEESVVARARALAEQLDGRRAQVQISVRITDVSLDALKELGVRWDWSSFTATEQAAGGIAFGRFTHEPVNIDATLSAMETDSRAKLLAAPTLSLLDGERGFILIGDRLIFPKLIGYTQASTPIFDKEEERVGIYLQVAVQTASQGEVTLTIYPQVSMVSSYLTVNGASYPQISTREQQTTVRVRDGQRIVVGGLIRDEELRAIQRVPFLARIPLFGELFTYRKTTKRRSEVIIMITPRILPD